MASASSSPASAMASSSSSSSSCEKQKQQQEQEQEQQKSELLPLDLDELSRASALHTDFDLAYRLQLQEVLSASRDGADDLPELPPSSPQDRSLAFEIQNLELSQRQQRALDRCQTVHEVELLQLDLKRRAHDAKFAKSLEELDESDWESHGDICEDPFEPEESEEDLLTCRLYSTAAISETTMERPNARAAVGALVLDAQGNVMTELRKPLDSGTSKTAADYEALIAGLEMVYAMRLRHVEAHTDSVTLYNQVRRRWKVRSRKLQGLWSQVMEYVRKLEHFNMLLDPRSENSRALRLAREAINIGILRESNSKVNKVCTICFEGKQQAKMFSVAGCAHEFCLSCIIQHAEVKVQAGQVPVQCPEVGCRQTLSLDQCQSILSPKWYDLLNKRLIEVNMPESDRVYCPFPNCSALMSRKVIVSREGAGATECMECHRLFCLDCRVPWHVAMSCDYYQKLPPALRDAQDAKLYQLAEHQNWQRCKMCRRMIELSEGCYHMTCRCGYEFCYLCGAPWKAKRQTCKCRLWDEDFLLDEPISESDDDEYYDSEEESDDYSPYFEELPHEDSASFEEEHYDHVNGRSRSPPRNPFYKTKLCRHWQNGNCYFGSTCSYAHGVFELRWH